MSTSADSVRTLHYVPSHHTLEPSDQTVKHPHTTFISNSQHTLGYSSTVLVLSMPSPSSSPAIGSPNSSDDRSLSPSPSESSLPESVSSSFFFSSSGAGSPRHGGLSSLPLSGEEQEHVQEDEIRRSQRHRSGPPSLVIPSPLGLLLPSLPLPHSLRRPTTFGQTLGSLRILVLSSGSSSNLTNILLEHNEDIVDVGEWEAWPGGAGNGDVLGRVVKVSTDWKRRWAKGNIALYSGGESENSEERLFEFEPSRNVEIVELERCAEDVDVSLFLIFTSWIPNEIPTAHRSRSTTQIYHRSTLPRIKQRAASRYRALRDRQKPFGRSEFGALDSDGCIIG